MRKFFVFCLMAAVAIVANANLLITIEDAEGNPVTVSKDTAVNVISNDPEEYEMAINGTIVDKKGALTIEIQRQETDIQDVCCAAGSCISGNGELTQTCSYTINTNNTWFAHVEAPEGADTYQTTIVYTFRMGSDARVLTVTYSYMTQTAVENTAVRKQGVKRVINGQLFIEKNGHLYNLLGAQMN